MRGQLLDFSAKKLQYYGFKPEQKGDYLYGIERIKNVLDEIKEIHQEHWDETEVLYLSRPMDVDYDRYVMLEDAARFLLFTSRDVKQDGKLVGVIMYYISSAIHQKSILKATEDEFFISKSARKGRNALNFLKFAEKCLVEFGVGMIGMSDKSPCGGKPLDRLLGHLGYKPVSINYGKEVGKDVEDKCDNSTG